MYSRLCTVDCRKLSQTSLIAVLHLCLDIKLFQDFPTRARVVPYQPVHCNITKKTKKKTTMKKKKPTYSRSV